MKKDPVVLNWCTPTGTTVLLTLEQVRQARDTFDAVYRHFKRGGHTYVWDKLAVTKRGRKSSPALKGQIYG